MPFRSDGGWIVNVVILLILVGVAGPRLFPDQQWTALAWWAGVGLAGGYLLTVLVESRGAAAERRKTRTTLDRLAGLRSATGSPDEIAAEADALLAELGQMFVQLPDLVATPGLVEAARTPGPHRVACLRLILRRAYLAGEPWIETLVDGRDALADAPLDLDEQERLQGLSEFLVNRARRQE